MNSNNTDKPDIWVIDDDQSIRWVLERALSNAGFRVRVFETASSALTQFKRAQESDRPRLILTDFRMPGINGFELLKQIKNLDPALPVIIMTAYSDLDTTVQAYQEGAFEYLAKPFDIDEAIALVTKACELSKTNSANQSDSISNTRPMPSDWREALQQWAENALANGDNAILKTATRDFEKTLIECALEATNGRKQDAAKLLGWGRNTLTRKMKHLS